MSYRIKTVAQLTGISATTLRAWERRYELLEPVRTENGYRVYTDEEITTLKRVRTLVDRGMKPREAFDLVRRRSQQPPAADASPSALEEIGSSLLDSLLLLDRERATQTYSELGEIPPARQVDEVILPLMNRVGDLWGSGDCSVAQEHFSSAFVRERLVHILEVVGKAPMVGSEVICAGAPGELHEFGLMSAAIHLSMRGWRVTYLGANLPVEEIEAVAAERQAALVCTSIVTSRSRKQCEALAASLKAVAPAGTIVVLGGRGIPSGMRSRPDDGVYFLRSIHELFEIGAVAAS